MYDETVNSVQQRFRLRSLYSMHLAKFIRYRCHNWQINGVACHFAYSDDAKTYLLKPA